MCYMYCLWCCFCPARVLALVSLFSPLYSSELTPEYFSKHASPASCASQQAVGWKNCNLNVATWANMFSTSCWANMLQPQQCEILRSSNDQSGDSVRTKLQGNQSIKP